VCGRDLLIFTHEMSTLLGAGMPLDRSLSILTDLSERPEMKRIVADVLQSVQRGKSLAEALAQHPKVFPPIYINMVKAGEIGGVLDHVLARLTEYLERANELRDEVRSAMVYPLILLFTAFISVTILLTYVLPKFGSIFAQAGHSLPFTARMLLGLSDAMRSYWWIGVIVIGLGTVGMVHFLRTPGGRLKWDNIKLRLVLLGDLTRKVAVARFARTLGTLLRSGVPMLQALEIVRDVVGNLVLAGAIDQVKVGVRDGQWHDVELWDAPVRVKVTDEGGKIPINFPSGQLEAKLFPLLVHVLGNMGVDSQLASSIADSVVDWEDDDDEHRVNGAESDYYLGLPNPYPAKNKRLDSIEELLLIKGITPDLYNGGTKQYPIGLRDVFSIFNNTGEINLRYATPQVKQVLFGLDDEELAQIEKQADSGQGGVLPVLEGRLPVELQGSNLVSETDSEGAILFVEAQAQLPSSRVKAHVGAVVDIENSNEGIVVLRWMDQMSVVETS
jgi:hypothetical protein